VAEGCLLYYQSINPVMAGNVKPEDRFACRVFSTLI
jgi:hypothetical protein